MKLLNSLRNAPSEPETTLPMVATTHEIRRDDRFAFDLADRRRKIQEAEIPARKEKIKEIGVRRGDVMKDPGKLKEVEAAHLGTVGTAKYLQRRRQGRNTFLHNRVRGSPP